MQPNIIAVYPNTDGTITEVKEGPLIHFRMTQDFPIKNATFTVTYEDDSTQQVSTFEDCDKQKGIKSIGYEL